MADRFVVSHIRRLPMFQAMSTADLERLAALVRVMRFMPGEYVFQQWQVAQGLYMFVSGQGVLLQQRPDGSQAQVGVIAANQFLNEAALHREYVETASLYVTQPAIVLFLSRDAYHHFRTQAVPAPPSPGPGTQPSRMPQPGAAPPPNFGRITPPATLTPPATPPPPAQPERPSPIQSRVAPQERTFMGRRPSENVILMVRRHWMSWVRRCALAMLLAALLFVLSTVVPSEISLLLWILNLVLPIAIIVYSYVNWLDDWLIVTTERVLHIEQHRFTFSTEVSELPIKSVQSINADLPANDPLAYAFKYGSVDIRTAGNSGNIVMHFVPDPEAIKDIIFQYREQVATQETQIRQREALESVLAEQFNGAPAQPNATPKTPVYERPGLLSMRFVNTDGETVYRKHVLFWLRKTFVPGLVLLGAIVLGLLGLFLPVFEGVRVIVLLGAVFVLLVGTVWFYYADWDWRNDLYMIGDTSLTIIRRRPFFMQDEDNRLLLERVDNIVTERSGLLRKIFNYGNVNIALVGDEKPHVFKNVHNPQDIREEISRRRARQAQRVKEEDVRRQRAEVAEAIRLYHERYGTGGGGQPGQIPPGQLQPGQPQPGQSPRLNFPNTDVRFPRS